jgi:hypothetical protein
MEKKKLNTLKIFFELAGAEGFEPSVTDPKSVALPLGYAPTATLFYR